MHAERRWYLVARDRDRDAWRTFRVDRLREPWTSGHRFVRDEEPDAGAMVSHGMAQAAYGWHATLLLEAGPEAVAQEVPPTVGILEPTDDGRTLLHLSANDIGWIARYVAGLPFDAVVVNPPEAPPGPAGRGPPPPRRGHASTDPRRRRCRRPPTSLRSNRVRSVRELRLPDGWTPAGWRTAVSAGASQTPVRAVAQAQS